MVNGRGGQEEGVGASTLSQDWNRMRMPLAWMANAKMQDNIGNRRLLRLLST